MDDEVGPLFEITRKDGGEPCGECHIQPGETCDICGAVNREVEVPFHSVAIARLIEEVRVEKEAPPANAYNRTYSRHNR